MFAVAIYRLVTSCYFAFIHVAAFTGNAKAKKWVNGRKSVTIKPSSQFRIWFHCASLGEFEQAKPLIEKIKAERAEVDIAVTFFSPSGYEPSKKYPYASVVTYLPEDHPTTMRSFINALNPGLAVFVKYDFWYFALHTLHISKIPTILVSANFRGNQPFFAWYGTLHRRMLQFFNQIFVQNIHSQELLQKIGFTSTIANDTRFDRVKQISMQAKNNPITPITLFCNNQPVLVAGSTWHEDEIILAQIIQQNHLKGFRFIIAPHDVTPERLQQLKRTLQNECILLSEYQQGNETKHKVLVIDSIGMLSAIYQYARVAYVGGAFGVSVHNVLEPAVYGVPVIYGPNYYKSQEAIDLLNMGAGFTVSDSTDFMNVCQYLLDNEHERLMHAAEKAKQYVNERTGGTDIIWEQIQPYIHSRA